MAQNADHSYFPYAVGDSVVFNISYPGTHSVWISGDVLIGGSDYFVVNGIQGRRSPDTLRVENDQVIRLDNGAEYVLYDFSLPDSSVYLVHERSFSIVDTFRVTVERRVSEDVPAGSFSDCIRLHFDIPQYVDDEWTYAFCRGIGLVWHGGGWGGGTLEWASIGGVVITSVEELQFRQTGFQLFPNPAADEVTIRIAAGRRFNRNIEVFDVLGRRVARFHVDPEEYSTVRIDVSGMPSGVYVARVRDADSEFSRIFLVAR